MKNRGYWQEVFGSFTLAIKNCKVDFMYNSSSQSSETSSTRGEIYMDPWFLVLPFRLRKRSYHCAKNEVFYYRFLV